MIETLAKAGDVLTDASLVAKAFSVGHQSNERQQE
jgi:hypothetical protein